MVGGEIAVSRVIYDSRQAQTGSLFVAVPGSAHDGAAFVGDAIARGAAAIAAERGVPVPDGVGLLLVPDARQALGPLASALLGNPSEQLRLIGVTGTDGKTTTCRLIAAALASAGRRVGWLTTVEMGTGDLLVPNPYSRTTPEASDLQEALAGFVAAGVEDAVVEVSSHGLALHRVSGCNFDAAVFTNLSPEHLDFHDTVEAYARAKARLFEMLDTPTHKRWSRMGVVNADDPSSVLMAASSPVGIVSFGLETAADVTATHLELQEDRSRFVLVTPIGQWEVTTPLVGRHNVSNWLAAAAVALGWGLDMEAVASAAETVAAPAGRYQRVRASQPFEVIVDFAHTPQALTATLETLRSLSTGRLYLVFGMAGKRDTRNRPSMGAIAARMTDFFIISTDDPQEEDPAAIAGEIEGGARAAGANEGSDYVVLLDRRSAIRAAIGAARAGDVVLLAGKGHERRMLLAGTAEPWSDEEEALEALRSLGYR